MFIINDNFIREHVYNHDNFISEHDRNHDNLTSEHVYIVECHINLNVMRDI